MTENWRIELTGPARRALENSLPEHVAWAAYAFMESRLASNPHRAGGALSAPYDGLHAARLGTYRIVYRIDEEEHAVFVLTIRLRADVYGLGR